MRTLKLKHVADIRVSNVDKLSVDGELPVRLCNYTDVYNNPTITRGLPFMKATATRDQVKAFTLHTNDIVITKDSESAADIGVPARVTDDIEGLVCGYHLAIVRPRNIDGRFLYWVLRSQRLRDAFQNAATGVTRFGLRTDAVGSVAIPSFTDSAQRRIAGYLDAEAARIDALIAKRLRMTALLLEAESARHDELFTNASWPIARNKNIMREIVDPSSDGDGELLTVSHLTGVGPRSAHDVNMFLAESLVGYRRVSAGDLVINTMWAWMGALGVSPMDGLASPSYGTYRFDRDVALPRFFHYLFRTPRYVAEMERFSTGVWTSRLRLYPDVFLGMRVPVPPLAEQARLVAALDRAAERSRVTRAALNRQIELLRERRQALITAAVSGEMEIPGAT